MKTKIEITGRLENWYWDNTHKIIYGNIYDDIHNRWWDGARIHTSLIVDNRDVEEGDTVKTLNSLYLLGEPFSNE